MRFTVAIRDGKFVINYEEVELRVVAQPDFDLKQFALNNDQVLNQKLLPASTAQLLANSK